MTQPVLSDSPPSIKFEHREVKRHKPESTDDKVTYVKPIALVTIFNERLEHERKKSKDLDKMDGI